jgi:hypothetical protein
MQWRFMSGEGFRLCPSQRIMLSTNYAVDQAVYS